MNPSLLIFSVLLMFVLSPLQAGESGSRVKYMGGTVTGVANKSSARLETAEEDGLRFSTAKTSVLVPYKDVNTLEYGLKVSRRYVEAALISPVFLLGKKKTHFLTIGYSDQNGAQQAMVLQVEGSDIRPLLVSLEARTGRRVEFQDDEARKAGKG